MIAHRTRRTLGAVLLLIAGLAMPLIPATRAHAASLACDGQNDIADVQALVDQASNGDSIELSGTCDFTTAAPHGGDQTSIDHAAVLVRPGSPVTNLTIRAGQNGATILGSGSQAAFALAPGNDGTTLSGLRFVNVSRAVVVLGADGVTVGNPVAGPVPSPNGLRVVGNTALSSAILAVADSTSQTVGYGAGGVAGSATFVPGDLNDLTVRGNYVTYAPPGPSGPLTATVAYDVRQVGTATITGVEIAENVVGMFTSEFASFDQNGVRVWGHGADPGSYRISDVEIRRNNIGRLEEISPARVGNDINPSEAHSGGRIGIVVARATGVTVADNSVRARRSLTGNGTPGGGIVIGDSYEAVVRANKVQVSADPTVPEYGDLGAISVSDGVPALRGDVAADPGTAEVEVAANVIGEAPFGAGRGVVINGASKVTVHENDVISSRGPAAALGAEVRSSTVGGRDMSTVVGESVVCTNRLDGVVDDPAAIAFDPFGHGLSRANAFPGGALHTGNFQCAPTLNVTPPIVTAGGDLTAFGSAWADRPVTVHLFDEQGAHLQQSGTATPNGQYSVAFPTADIDGLVDGVLTLYTTVTAPDGFSLNSAVKTAKKNYVQQSPLAGTVFFEDGDGHINLEETLIGVPSHWAAPNEPVSHAVAWWSDGAGSPPPQACGPITVAHTGSVNMPFSCANSLPDGVIKFNVKWVAGDGEESPVVSDSSNKDMVSPNTPIVIDPAENATKGATVITVSGSAEPQSTVNVRRSDPPYADLGVTTTDTNGAWSVQIDLGSEGRHRISAQATDAAKNRSASSTARNFSVSIQPPEDTTPPLAPEILTPDPNNVELRPGKFVVGGYGEPGARVDVYVQTTQGPFLLGQAAVASTSGWGAEVSLPDGIWTLHAFQTDPSNNVSPQSNTTTVDVDASPPELAIYTNRNQPFLFDDVSIEGEARDNRSVGGLLIEYFSADGASYGPFAVTCADCPSTANQLVMWHHQMTLRPGYYTARVRAFDAAGNVTTEEVLFFAVKP